jgi:hypothetical protein
MASVRLNFVRPDDEGLAKLLIYESTTQTGSYSLIETVTDIGEWPDYITYYTTNLATDPNDWFVIEWEDDKGARSPRSNPIKGNTTTTVGEITKRVLLRDPSLEEGIAAQEAEISVSDYFRVDDPYTIDPTVVTYKEWGGLTYLTLARIYISEVLVGSSVSGYTAGIVAQQQGNSQKSLDDIKRLIEEGNKLLNRNFSLVMQLEPVAFGTSIGAEVDQSRLLVELI